ncbi:MAG: type II secretion system protein GspD, partial [Gammaproteobacteria bacterium]
AQIKVGDQVPVLSSTTTTEGGVVTQSIQFRDTGVLLEVSPRVNAGGLVTLEITQNVVDVGEIEPTTNQRRFLNRNIKSVVVVQSGQSIVLGGLIRDNRSLGKGGVPGLYQIPVLGNLFGSTKKSVSRTELIVLLTPRVVRSQLEARKVTEEISAKLQGLQEMLR